MAFARTVVQDHQVSQLLDAETASQPRLGEVFDGLTWLLARGPEVGYAIPGTHPPVYVVRSSDWPGVKGIIVLAYTFDAEQVVLIGARVEKPDAAAALKLA